MRLFVALAAFATANAFMGEDNFLKRTRRDDEEVQCDEGEVEINGFCTDDAEIIEKVRNFDAEIEAEETPNLLQMARRFPMPGQTEDSPDFDGLERAKRRSQRITLLVAQLPKSEIKPRLFMKRINNYGCNCWTKGKKSGIGGSGQPIDELDRVCKELSRCHQCIGIDYSYETCDPVKQKYKAKLATVDGKVQINCVNQMNKKGTNNGDCKKSLCECDKKFAEGFAIKFQNWNEDYWQLDMKGQYESSCNMPKAKMGGMGGGGPNQCCGAKFPDKKPFNDETHKCEDNEVLGINML